MLLSGPNSVNSLLHILLKDQIAVIADIEQMFYSFYVKPDHRDYLRFFWYRDNDINNDLNEYRMCTHAFGNSPSPAVATFGLRKTVENAEDVVKDFVEENVYVDDGLISLPETDNVIDLVLRTQKHLQTANLTVCMILWISYLPSLFVESSSREKSLLEHIGTSHFRSRDEMECLEKFLTLIG